MRTALITSLLSISACTTAVSACDFRDGSINGAEPRCQERIGAAPAGVHNACVELAATPVAGGCPAEDRVGGCLLTGGVNGRKVVDWYYEPTLIEEVRSDCSSLGGELVAAE